MSVHAAHPSLLDRFTATSASIAPVRVGAVMLAVAATAAAAQFTAVLPFTRVPFALTPMVVLLTGAALGSRLGATAQATYLLAGVVGLPVFVPSAVLLPGVGRLADVTGGYLLAYPLAAFAVGWLAERGWDRRYLTSALAMTVGLVVIYVGGVSWLSTGGLPGVATFDARPVMTAFAAGVAPFLLADLLKVAAAALILPQAWKLLR